MLLLAIIKQVQAGEGGPPPPSSSAIEAFYTAGTVNFRPIEFKVENVKEVVSIEWVNQPDNINDILYSFKTDDGVNYRLEGYPAYNGIFKAGLTTVELLITSENGNSITLSIPVVVVSDNAPVATITSPGPLQYNKGHHSQIAVQLNDPGRNIMNVHALLYIPGNDQNIVAVIGERSWEKYLSEIEYIDYDNWDWFYHEIYETQAKTNSDLINYRLPIHINENVNIGEYDLRIEVIDNKGNISLSGPQTVNVIAPATPPRLTITPPDYRIPAGQSYYLNFAAEHLDRLDRIEFLQTGPVGADVTSAVTFSTNDFTQNGRVTLTIPQSAVEGQVFTVTTTLYDVNGNSKTVNAEVNVGLWGERTVSVTANQEVDATMQFANVTVTSGNTLRHLDDNISFNSLTIESGAKFIARIKELVVNGTLTVDGQLVVNEKKSYQYLRDDKPQGGQHGGDTPGIINIAYGDFYKPNFPGSSTNINANFTETGGRLHIIANDVLVNTDGLIKADGLPGRSSGGGVLVFETSSLLVDGSVTTNGRSQGAGGSINITTTDFSGSGTISANAGSSAYAAGGRIAILYDSFVATTQPAFELVLIRSAMAAPGDSPITDMNINALPGLYSGAGTIFLKRSDQAYGELYVDNGGNYDSNGDYNYTTLSTLGKHIISNVEPVPGEPDSYKVTVEGRPWLLENIYAWEAGIVGKQLSLNALDKSAPIYEVIEERVADDGINLSFSDVLANAGEPGSVKHYPVTVTQDELVYIELDDKEFPGKVFVFKDSDNDGVVTTSDLYKSAEIDTPASQFKPFKKVLLEAGNYIVAVSKRFVSAGEAVSGQSNSNQLCLNCQFTLTIRSAETNTFIIKSSTPPVFSQGNELIGVVRLNHLKVSTGSRLRGTDRIHVDTFDIAEEIAIENIPEIISPPNVFADHTVTSQNTFYIGDLTANSLVMVDGAEITIYGDLNVTNNLTIQSTPDTGYGYGGGGTVLPSSLAAKNITVGGDILISETPLTLKTEGTITANNFSLLSNSSITVPNADAVKKKLYSLDMDISGK